MSSLNIPNKPLEPFNVLAFDPGGTTGWAQAILTGPIKDDVKLSDIALSTGEFGPEEHHEDLHCALFNLQDDAGYYGLSWPEIVFEPFHYRQNVVGEGVGFRGKVELISAEYIGVIKLACAQYNMTYYDRFTPGEAKAYVTDEKLRRLGWLQEPVTPMRHRNDALRQLVKYLIVKKGIQHPITSAWRI